MKLSEFGEKFLFLAHRIDKHNKGYVDFYIGPENIREIVNNEAVTSPNILLTDCNALQNNLFKQGYDKKRERYLEKLLRAMETSIEILNDTEISIKEQFLRLYDINLQPVKESELDSLKEEYNAAYGGLGSLEKRMSDIRVRRTVPEDKVFELFKKALNITRDRTKELFIDLLPKKERIALELVNNNEEAKWSYYNWYLGNFCSKIEVNPNYNIYWSSLLSAAAHEGYPGHHMEFAVKEQHLYRKLSQFEHSLLILHSPKIIISEGIGNLAISVIFSDRDAAEISLSEFCPILDTPKTDTIDELALQNNVRRKLSLFWYNLAYRALIEEYNTEELIRYGKNFEVFSEDTIQNNLKRMSDPVYSKNAFLYDLGSNLIRNRYGIIPSVKNFQNLLENAILPSDLKRYS